MKTTITEGERLQLWGLITLGRKYQKMSDEIRIIIGEIIEEDDSLLGDSLYDYSDPNDIDRIIKDLNIKVKNER
jgi:hypothetical protein